MRQLFITCMQTVLSAEKHLRSAERLGYEAPRHHSSGDQPSFMFLSMVLSSIIILLGMSILFELLNYVNSTVDIQNARKKVLALDVDGKEMWSDDDDNSTVADVTEPFSEMTLSMLAHPPPGWRPPRSCLINSY